MWVMVFALVSKYANVPLRLLFYVYLRIENCVYGIKCDSNIVQSAAIQQRSFALSIQHINPKGKRKYTEKVKKTIRNMPRFSSGLLHA